MCTQDLNVGDPPVNFVEFDNNFSFKVEDICFCLIELLHDEEIRANCTRFVLNNVRASGWSLNFDLSHQDAQTFDISPAVKLLLLGELNFGSGVPSHYSLKNLLIWIIHSIIE